jgi:predicted helicase
MFGICSDDTAGNKGKKAQLDDQIVAEMPISATTDPLRVLKAYNAIKNDGRIHFFFSTYQSIDVIHDVEKACGIVFDMAICDEAHRTIGAYKNDSTDDQSDFTKIHDAGFIYAKKRLYMTATEKIYTTQAKNQANDEGWQVFSMDDEKTFGPRFYFLSFGAAVTQGLLSDYRLIVLQVRKSQVASLNLPQGAFANLDEAAKIVGSVSALSKISSEENPNEFVGDPVPMKRAVAFCSTIAAADSASKAFNSLSDATCLGLEYMTAHKYIIPDSQLITGQDNSDEKNKKLSWLRADIEDNHCHILTNARCLSEGVDVPSLDAVIFMAKKRSQVDIIQAVGRVMRRFGSGNMKRYGYIIIPVVINDEKLTDKTLNNSEDYHVVWQIVQALRSHDERLDNEINKIGYSGKLPANICELDAFIPPKACKPVKTTKGAFGETGEGNDTDHPNEPNGVQMQMNLPTPEELKANEELFAAHLVKHCGDRLYWEDWSKDIGDVTNNVALKIKNQVETISSVSKEFTNFKIGLSRLLNPSISDDDCINMLAEHLVTLPVLNSIFGQTDFASQNAISQIMQSMLSKLENLDKEIESLQPFYESVKKNVEGITTTEGRQDLIRKLFEKFFKYALPMSAEKFGIVYTPIEIVDFIINSVDDILKDEFRESLINPGVTILDPFTGTGTFIVRALEKMKERGATVEQLDAKYSNDIWCNELMLLAYYIALINVEDTFGRLSGNFKPFEHAVLTDTFQMAEKRNNKFYNFKWNEHDVFAKANAKAAEEDASNIQVIISNPPYSAGQGDANKNNANEKYQTLDTRIAETYRKGVEDFNVRSLYDSYVRAFRWATDRINENGIISFVSNGSYIDNLAFAGFRRSLLSEFQHVYVYNLRGNQRTQGELSKKEGGKVFGSGSRNTICIILLVKHKGRKNDGYVHYCDIGDYLSKEEKLEKIKKQASLNGIQWQHIFPDKNNDWLNQKNDSFSRFNLIGSKDFPTGTIFSRFYSRGIATGKDSWQYNFSHQAEIENNQKYLSTYNARRIAYFSKHTLKDSSPTDFANFALSYHDNIKWSNALFIRASRNEVISDNNDYRITLYRPFVKVWAAFNPPLFYDFVKWGSVMPQKSTSNLIIGISAPPLKRRFSTLISNEIMDLHLLEQAQVFPFYWYSEKSEQGDLFDTGDREMYLKQESMSEESLASFKSKYNDPSIKKEDIFYYIYGVFHSSTYIEKYGNNLSKEFPRIPYLRDFWAYSRIGRSLANLHLNYEKATPYQEVVISKTSEDYSIRKIRFLSKERKDVILFNDYIRIEHIPLKVYDYLVNGRSPLEWVIDQYQYSTDPESGIINDPNKYDPEKGGKYVFDLILSLITVSLRTQELISLLPTYEEF